MRRSAVPILFICLLTVLPCLAGAQELPGAGSDAGKTVIYRDTWGVPHIYAPTVEAGFYAMGWAQAQDRPEDVLKNFLRGMGELASVEGKGSVDDDRVSHMWRLYEGSKENYEKCRPEVRAHLEAFVRGINDYYAANPNEVPAWWGSRKVDPHMVNAFGRMFLQSWSFDDGFSDLKRGGIEPGMDETQRASNQWAVSPARSANKAAILLIDPHLGWLGVSRFWEFRVHAGEWQGSGFALPGIPYIALGHNANVAWAMTTGGPDTADVFSMTVNKDNPMQYHYDNGFKDFTVRKVTLNVKDAGPVELTLLDSHHGPVVAIRGGKAYAIRSSYADAYTGNDAWYEFNFAKDYRGVVAGLATQQLFPQNVMAADTSGNIYFQHTGRVPIRVDGHDWTRPVDGSTSATEWKGIHPSSDLIQIANPPQGYMQCCNVPPDVIMVDSPFSWEKSKPYVWTSSGDDEPRYGISNQRGARAVELLAADDSVTIEEALAYANDMNLYGAKRWVQVLKIAHEAQGASFASNASYAAGINEVLSWDCNLTPDSKGALKYYYWRKQLVKDHGQEAVDGFAKTVNNYMESVGKPSPELHVNDNEKQLAAQSFANAMSQLREDFGSLDKTYGDVFRVGRDDKSWPVGGGGDGDLDMTTLRNVKYHGERPDHTRWGRAGQTSTQIVVMTKPVQSWTYVPHGQSDRPESPHYTDQAEKAFSPCIMKSTWWTPQELKGHTESRTVLENAK